MGGIIAAAAMALGLIVCAALYARQRRAAARLAAQIEDFLSGRAERLEYSVKEDAMAPLNNQAAELAERCLSLKRQLARERARAERMTADISHQLKTPLSALRLYLEMDAGPHLAAQLNQIERMERLISALLRLERLCADGYAFHFAENDVRQIALNAWAPLGERFKQVRFELSGQGVIRCDAKWLEEALGNLFKNACEQQRRGGLVAVRLEKSGGAFFITVSDRGGGVSPDQLPRLFERFYRAPGAGGEGCGLGLAIARAIVERHHGRICARNAGEGLSIHISLPVFSLAKS